MQSPVPISGNAKWRKSTSSDQGENCVELWRGTQVTALRDSKNVPGPVLTLPTSALTALLGTVTE